MKRRGAVGVGLIAAAITGGCMVYGYVQQPAATAEYTDWRPTAATIREEIGTEASPAHGMTEKQRRELFCQLFKDRFRFHTPNVAIGLRFVGDRRLKLMCPARLEPFLVDRVALAAWREASADFGRQMDVDIYATFIGTTQVKIGELRASGSPPVAHIEYDFDQIGRMNHPRVLHGPLTINGMLPAISPPSEAATFERHGN